MTEETKRVNEDDMKTRLEEAEKELAYYKRLSREAGDRRLREGEEQTRLILKLEAAEKEVAERNEKLADANRCLEMEVKERKTAQLELQKRKDAYKRIITESAVGIAAYDGSGRCLATNDAFSAIVDMDVGRILKEDYHDMAFWKNSGLIEKAKVALEENRTVRVEVETDTGGQGRLNIDCHLTPSFSGGVLLILNDISDKKRALEKLFEAQKMEAIATLAGGIAHDFNNELFTITAYLDLLRIELSSQTHTDKYLDSMVASSKRMALLTGYLLAYAHGGKYQPKAISMSRFVKNSMSIMKSMVQPDIRLAPDLPEGVPAVLADPTQLQMVLSAVMANASEAILGEGMIRVVVREERLEAASVGDAMDIKPGRYVMLAVEDTGVGMDETTRSKIFEPFFSTKFEGRGLGMAAVHGIVKNHDGWVFVESKMGKGTVVKMFFPVV